MSEPTLAEQISAVEEAIAAERKGLALLGLPGLTLPPDMERACNERIARLKAAVRTLRGSKAADATADGDRP